MDTARIVIDAPPVPPAPTQPNPLARLMPVVTVVAMGGMVALYLTSTDSAARSPMFLLFPAMMVVSLIGTLVHGARGAGRPGEFDGQRRDYLRYLDTVDAALAVAGEAEFHRRHREHPHPASLWELVVGERVWERTADHAEFGSVRVGIGAVPTSTVLVAPEQPSAAGTDPVTTDALERLLTARAAVDGVPVTLHLPSSRIITAPRTVARALVCQAVATHHPAAVGVHAAGADWDWIKWLPHHRDWQRARHRIVICDGAAAPEVPEVPESITVVVVPADDTGDGSAADESITVDVDGSALPVRADRLSAADATACARMIARAAAELPAAARPGIADWPTLLGIADPAGLDPARQWSAVSGRGLLTTPVGVTDDGSPVSIDIKEAAAKGMGPHGLCVGATGSGKSEFLRTLVLGLVARHPPELLNMVLVDFKGGATFLGLERLNHVSAVITNLADDAPLVSRMRDALAGEVNRRQEVLRAAGNFGNVTEYARRRDRAQPTLPALFVVVDEFSELLSRHPEFADLFVAIGRLGRSLGIHLLLASQRLEEGRLRGLETHLSYRICLKTFSASESRAVLGVPDAYHLPSQPGAAYLSTSAGDLIRFRTAFVSGDYTPPARVAQRRAVRPFTLGAAANTGEDPTEPVRPLLTTVLDRLAGHGTPAHRVWLPPLGAPPQLVEVLGAASARPLVVPIGVVDCPFEQRREPLWLDVSAAAGHVAVVGAPRSGKSTTLRTMVCALADAHDPAEVQFYCLDFGGGELAALRTLPHVGSVAARGEDDLCRRTVAQLETLLRSRESVAAPENPCAAVFLVVDGWATLRQEFDPLEPRITAMAARGLAYGIHVMISASRWADLRPALKDHIGTRIELRLGDPSESEMDRRRARELADRPAGRGLTRDGRETAIAWPDEDRVRRHPGASAPRVELLPGLVERNAISGAQGHRANLVLGVRESDLAAAALDVAAQPHLLVLGEHGCGKTSLLRLICTEVRTVQPDSRLELIDFRRGLLGVVETDASTGYSVSAPAVTSRLGAITEILRSRMPGENVTQRQLRDRSWWDGPDIWVVIDDYDLVAGATGNPLTPLIDYLPYAMDLGLHVVAARRSGGAARAMFDPLLARMRDMGCAGVMMSAAADDGVLIGSVRPSGLPPGRGTLVVRGRPDELVQIGWTDPPP